MSTFSRWGATPQVVTEDAGTGVARVPTKPNVARRRRAQGTGSGEHHGGARRLRGVEGDTRGNNEPGKGEGTSDASMQPAGHGRAPVGGETGMSPSDQVLQLVAPALCPDAGSLLHRRPRLTEKSMRNRGGSVLATYFDDRLSAIEAAVSKRNRGTHGTRDDATEDPAHIAHKVLIGLKAAGESQATRRAPAAGRARRRSRARIKRRSKVRGAANPQSLNSPRKSAARQEYDMCKEVLSILTMEISSLQPLFRRIQSEYDAWMSAASSRKLSAIKREDSQVPAVKTEDPNTSAYDAIGKAGEDAESDEEQVWVAPARRMAGGAAVLPSPPPSFPQWDDPDVSISAAWANFSSVERHRPDTASLSGYLGSVSAQFVSCLKPTDGGKRAPVGQVRSGGDAGRAVATKTEAMQVSQNHDSSGAREVHIVGAAESSSESPTATQSIEDILATMPTKELLSRLGTPLKAAIEGIGGISRRDVCPSLVQKVLPFVTEALTATAAAIEEQANTLTVHQRQLEKNINGLLERTAKARKALAEESSVLDALVRMIPVDATGESSQAATRAAGLTADDASMLSTASLKSLDDIVTKELRRALHDQRKLEERATAEAKALVRRLRKAGSAHAQSAARRKGAHGGGGDAVADDTVSVSIVKSEDAEHHNVADSVAAVGTVKNVGPLYVTDRPAADVSGAEEADESDRASGGASSLRMAQSALDEMLAYHLADTASSDARVDVSSWAGELLDSATIPQRTPQAGDATPASQLSGVRSVVPTPQLRLQPRPRPDAAFRVGGAGELADGDARGGDAHGALLADTIGQAGGGDRGPRSSLAGTGTSASMALQVSTAVSSIRSPVARGYVDRHRSASEALSGMPSSGVSTSGHPPASVATDDRSTLSYLTESDPFNSQLFAGQLAGANEIKSQGSPPVVNDVAVNEWSRPTSGTAAAAALSMSPI